MTMVRSLCAPSWATYLEVLRSFNTSSNQRRRLRWSVKAKPEEWEDRHDRLKSDKFTVPCFSPL